MSAQAAPASLDELVSYIESRFPVGEPTSSMLAVTGEEYVEICGRPVIGAGSEGYLCATFSSKRSAIEAAVLDFEKYAADKAGGTIYWRTKPELDEYKGRAKRLKQYPWRYYMRLLISSKPPLQSPEA